MAIDARRPSPFASARSWVPRVLAMLCLLLLWSSASAVTWFVDSTGGNDDDPGTSWPLAFRTVQRALDDHPTILCGDLLGDDGPAFSGRADNAFHVVTAEDVDATTRLETVIIRGGKADAVGSGLDDRGVRLLAELSRPSARFPRGREPGSSYNRSYEMPFAHRPCRST